MVNFQELNCDCLLLIVSYLSLQEQAKLAQCSKWLNALCLTESTLKAHVKHEFSAFPYTKIYAAVKSWKLTIQYHRKMLGPARVLIYEVIPNYVFRLANENWMLQPFGPYPGNFHMCSMFLQESIYMIECYQSAFNELIVNQPKQANLPESFWKLLFPVWISGNKTELWSQEAEGFTGPRGHYALSGWNNYGFTVRGFIHDTLQELAQDILNDTMDISQLPRSLPSVRNQLSKILLMKIVNVYPPS